MHYTEGALRRIAQKAMVKNTGARGLRSIMEIVLTDAMYQVSLPLPMHSSKNELTTAVEEFYSSVSSLNKEFVRLKQGWNTFLYIYIQQLN